LLAKDNQDNGKNLHYQSGSGLAPDDDDVSPGGLRMTFAWRRSGSARR